MKYKILKHVSLLLTFVLFTAALAGCNQTLPSGSEATDLSSLQTLQAARKIPAAVLRWSRTTQSRRPLS